MHSGSDIITDLCSMLPIARVTARSPCTLPLIILPWQLLILYSSSARIGVCS